MPVVAIRGPANAHLKVAPPGTPSEQFGEAARVPDAGTASAPIQPLLALVDTFDEVDRALLDL